MQITDLAPCTQTSVHLLGGLKPILDGFELAFGALVLMFVDLADAYLLEHIFPCLNAECRNGI
jgi:hypothetical protein